MKKLSKKIKQVSKEVRQIRARNNKLWMQLFDMALASNPREGKKIIRKIIENDMLVSKWMKRI